MASKQISDRDESFLTLKAIVTTHGDDLVRGLHALVEPVLAEGESPPDVEYLVELLVRVVDARRGRLKGADEAWHWLRGRERGLGKKRTVAARAIYRTLLPIRGIVRSLDRKLSLEVLAGIGGDLPRTSPRRLLMIAKVFLRRIAGRRFDDSVVEVDFDGLGSKLSEETRRLDDLIKRHDKAGMAASARAYEKSLALDDFNDGFADVADVLSALLRASGHPKWAEAAQPSRQEKGLLHRQVRERRARRAARRNLSTAVEGPGTS